jgi:hypothetical protein
MYGYDYWKTTDPNDTYENYLLAEKAGELLDEHDRLMDELKIKLDAMEQADDPNWGAADDLIVTLSAKFLNAMEYWEFDLAEQALDDLYNAL